MIESWGWRPRYQLAKRTLVYVLFAEPGGMKIINRSISPALDLLQEVAQ